MAVGLPLLSTHQKERRSSSYLHDTLRKALHLDKESLLLQLMQHQVVEMGVHLDEDMVFDHYRDLWNKHDKPDLLQRKGGTQKFPPRVKTRDSYDLFCSPLHFLHEVLTKL